MPIYIAVDDAKNILGVAAMLVVPNILNPDLLEAREFIWHTSTKLSSYQRAKLMLQLLDVMEDRTGNIGVDLHVSVPPTKSLTDMLERRGYKMKEFHYAREVSHGN